jgi:hypothetical protein
VERLRRAAVRSRTDAEIVDHGELRTADASSQPTLRSREIRRNARAPIPAPTNVQKQSADRVDRQLSHQPDVLGSQTAERRSCNHVQFFAIPRKSGIFSTGNALFDGDFR